MSRKRVNKSSRAKEFCDLLGEVGTHIALGCLNFSYKFCPTVHDCNQVFQVTATRVMILSSVTKGFQFRRTKVYGADHQNLEAWLQLTFRRRVHCGSIPCGLESQNLSVERHHIKGCRLLTPTTKRSAFPRVLTKVKCLQSLRKFGVSDVRSYLRDFVNVVGRAHVCSRFVRYEQSCCAPSDKNQLSENRLQKFGGIYEELEIRVDHKSPVADLLSRAQQSFAPSR